MRTIPNYLNKRVHHTLLFQLYVMHPISIIYRNVFIVINNKNNNENQTYLIFINAPINNFSFQDKVRIINFDDNYLFYNKRDLLVNFSHIL